MKDTTAVELLVTTIQEYMGYGIEDAKKYAEWLTYQCHKMYVEELEKRN